MCDPSAAGFRPMSFPCNLYITSASWRQFLASNYVQYLLVWMDIWIYGYMYVCMYGCMDVWMDGSYIHTTYIGHNILRTDTASVPSSPMAAPPFPSHFWSEKNIMPVCLSACLPVCRLYCPLLQYYYIRRILSSSVAGRRRRRRRRRAAEFLGHGPTRARRRG
jgi:hypothetical protein